MKLISDEHIYRLLKLLTYALSRLPVWFADFCSNLLGLLWFKIDKRHRTVTLENLTHCFGNQMGPKQIEIMGKQVFQNIAAIIFEVAWSQKFSKEALLSHFTIKGLEHIRAAHAKGRGVLVLTCHMGNFEMLAPAIYETGLKGYVIYRAFDFKPLDRLIQKLRRRFGVTVIPTRGAFKQIEAALAQGGIVGTLLDTNVSWHKGVFVNFFGRPACTNQGLAILALKSRAPVLPVYTTRKDRTFTIEFLPEIPTVETDDPIKNLEINTENYSNIIESMVRKYPDQYFWVHNRWKTKNFCPWSRDKDK
ncbi:lysophospholipid acyltransferase family protein [uncultured Desulfobacter sp.]|uniref:lysophospholipid acyltransferase family protein n=1 Tax=uncultured Desulfobacter sp. TaxID=240139 RepID=UPI0029F4952B|nr:lysophospholipid acyltransferase family protein [uncultured Desulfobacter sp.]